jgi:hypothetical protein
MGQVHTGVGDAQNRAHDNVRLDGGGVAPTRNLVVPEGHTPALVPRRPSTHHGDSP